MQVHDGDEGKTSSVVFREVQRFHQWFYWVPAIIVTAVVWYEFVQQIILGNPQGQEPLPNWAAWVLAIVFGLGIPAFALSLRIVTEVTADVLRVGVAPFRLREIPLDTIDTAMEREYAAMREFGGWGVRTSKYGQAYNAHGDKGVQLVLKDGSRILIGTQRPAELAEVLRAAGVNVVQ